jgi:hypothetical protein
VVGSYPLDLGLEYPLHLLLVQAGNKSLVLLHCNSQLPLVQAQR